MSDIIHILLNLLIRLHLLPEKDSKQQTTYVHYFIYFIPIKKLGSIISLVYIEKSVAERFGKSAKITVGGTARI